MVKNFHEFPQPSRIEHAESEHGLVEVENYLAEKHATLKHRYKSPEGHVESCGLIARHVAKMLTAAGENPSLMYLRGAANTPWGERSYIMPRIYEGRVRWGGHTVCINKNVVYDPMIGRPLSLEDYLSNTFMEPVEIEAIESTQSNS